MTNFITPDGCVCGFPSATLALRGAPRVEPLSLREQAALDVYRRRGFTIEKDIREEIDLWEYMFFGEDRLLAMTFRRSLHDASAPLPIRRTNRGWITDDGWTVDPPSTSIDSGE